MTKRKRKLFCAFCDAPATGDYAIHRDGFGEGPEVNLCDRCGSNDEPTERDIWAKIGQAATCIQCDEEIRSGDARYGSFHEWCYDPQHHAADDVIALYRKLPPVGQLQVQRAIHKDILKLFGVD